MPFDVIFTMPAPFTDHPSFPEGLLTRALEAEGFSVGIIERPRWQSAADFGQLGRPRLFYAIIPGPVDSVVLNYTSTGKRRREDLYQPDDNAFFADAPLSVSAKVRPDRTVNVFAARIREALGDVPLIIGGLEASLRRFAHYDFQQRKIRRPVLLDSRADLLVAGMGEKQVVAIARAAAAGEEIGALVLPGTVRISRDVPENAIQLPDAEAVIEQPGLLLEQYLGERKASHRNLPAAQKAGGRWIVSEPAMAYDRAELDAIYGRHYSRALRIPGPATSALAMNLFSVTTHRGCAGGCSFCSIAAHEGTGVVSRGIDSILDEVRCMQQHPAWKGIVGDIGGASAEMYGADCAAECGRESCLHPAACRKYAAAAGEPWRDLLARVRTLPGVRQVQLGSGVRYEVLLENPELLDDLLRHHAGRFLRVAPEHTSNVILGLMKKPDFETFARFVSLFRKTAARVPRPVRLAPYLVVGHPGETDEDVREMMKLLADLGVLVDADVQIFTPTPGSLATAMYCAGTDEAGRAIAVERDMNRLVARQQALINAGTARRGRSY